MTDNLQLKPDRPTKPKSIAYIQTICEQLNKQWFNDRLRFVVSTGDHRKGSVLAYVIRPDAVGLKYKIPVCMVNITPKLLYFTDSGIRDILLHELCHVAQYHHGLEGGHGPTMKRVGRLYNIPPEILDKKIEWGRL